MTVFTHWRDVRPDQWRWPSFSPAEIACRGTGRLVVNEAALDRLQALRDALGKPLIITSAYRSPSHNKKVGGAKNSVHLTGGAFDVSMSNHDPQAFEDAARRCGFTGFGYYTRQNFMHIDCGKPRSWGTAFPDRLGNRFADDAPLPPAREPVAVAATGAGTAAMIAGEPVVMAAEMLVTQQSELGSGDIGRIVAAIVVVGITLYLATRTARQDD
jgi:zinc D-Ala-D-Ala carboxypeptidase